MTNEPVTRNRRKVRIVRAEVYSPVDSAEPEYLMDAYGGCWAAIDESDVLVTCGPDIAQVTQAARFAGFWVSDQV